jgi:magnesium chelatase subunit D
MTATQAWEDAMTALALFASDPIGLGGIALRAGPGPVRDRFLELLREILPREMQIRRLPLNTADDRLLGGLDLAATLQAGRPVEQKGLLAEADGGVVLLAMAERVEPGVIARLCAVMDQGSVALQRDGLTRDLPARFGLIALDEGAAPDERTAPALLDRLAFHLDLTTVAVGDLQTDCPTPRTQPVETPGDAAEALCATALAIGISSVRAPLLALRAARAAAAIAGRGVAIDDDLVLASRLVLAPRATCLPPSQEDADPPPPSKPPPPSDETPSDDESPDDKPLQDVVLEATRAALPANLLATLALAARGRLRSRAPGRVGQTQASKRRGRPIGTRQGDPTAGARLHVLETLKAAAPWQTLRRRPDRPARRIEVRRDDFRIVRFQQRTETTTVFAVDASGSAALHRLGEAKGAVELLLADCYVRRDQVALVAFRGREASLLLPPTGSLVRAKRCLAGLPGGGATPLAAGIDAALALADAERRRGRTPVIALLTDARANIARDGTGGRPRAEAEAMASARLLRASGVATLLVDTSPRPNPFARRLAEEMAAHYVPLPQGNASSLSEAVRGAVA